MNGRIYDPRIGRFLQPDPIVGRATYSQDHNRYNYGLGSPLNFTDPSGLNDLPNVRDDKNLPGPPTPGGNDGLSRSVEQMRVVGQRLTARERAYWKRSLSVYKNSEMAIWTMEMAQTSGFISANSGTEHVVVLAALLQRVQMARLVATANQSTTGSRISEYAARRASNQLDSMRSQLEQKLDALGHEGILSETQSFESTDQAALYVLSIVAPLSADFGYEVYGHILPRGERFYYTFPKIGEADWSPLTGEAVGYHTHPGGAFLFSNIHTYESGLSGGNDVGWVRANRRDLYLGVQIGGATFVGICRPYTCMNTGRFGSEPSETLLP